MKDRGGAGSFENVKEFLRYVQGGAAGPGGVPPAIVRELREMEERAKRVQALTGLMTPVELSPYVLDLLKAAEGGEGAAAEGVLNRIRA
jgi:hypothetical protein